ncbi:hypothetical protein KAR91_42435 [Candidatus Pacearchaeota archaeon]|nr:hypothetical protein [Candidatus Pacearchaeota archaeon]
MNAADKDRQRRAADVEQSDREYIAAQQEKTMVFEIWEFTDHVSKCIARRSQDDVREEYHDMKIGEQRQSEVNSSFFVMRTA